MTTLTTAASLRGPRVLTGSDQKDGQLESFMVVAQRQIAYLESQMKELQKAE